MKNKTTRRIELRRRINDVRRQSPTNYRYGAELKREIIEYTRECVAEGASIKQVARELDLSAGVLTAWLRRAKIRMEAETARSKRRAPSQSIPLETPDPSSLKSEPDDD
jgi:transposase-like protein